jgi:hypothetical protein
MPVSEIGTIGGLVEFLVDQGIKVGVAAELVAKAFGWGVDAAKFRAPENLLAPQIKVSNGQISFLEEVPPSKPRRKKEPSQIACKWPDDFMLGDEQIKYAADRGFNISATQMQWERFRDRNIAKGFKYEGRRGWEAAWRTWINNKVEWANEANQQRKPDMIDGRL